MLLHAASLFEEDPTPYAILQYVALALSGRAAGEDWLAKCLVRDPYNYRALLSHSNLLMQKWYGRSAMESVDFAGRNTENKCPKNHPSHMVLISVLLAQYRDAAWSPLMRQLLITTPWVRNRTLDIFRRLYADHADPPLKTLVERERFQTMLQWLTRCVEAGALEPNLLRAAKEIEAAAYSSASTIGTDIV